MKKLSILLLVIVAAFTACKKTPEVNLKYVDVERDLITVGTTTATVQCDYQYITTLKKAYFYYGEGTEEVDMNTAEMRVVQNTLYVDLAGLKENTTYSYYYEFVNGFNSMRSATKTFKTETGNGGGDEPPTPPEVMLPTVITASVTEITANSANCGGEVTNDGGAEVTERGICWSTSANPTLNNNHVAAGTGIGAFVAIMNGLEASTTYHVRAYATNEAGTAYGLDREFTTLSGGGSGVPEGAIDGLFTINENGDQVYFSQGNLQYQASTNTWRFAEKQWDYVGGVDYNQNMLEYGNVYENGVKCDNAMISSTYSGWIDLFGYGTSGYNHGAICYQPWSISYQWEAYYAYGSFNYNLNDQSGQADWGYNRISNGGNVEGCWRTLSNEEWDYLINVRSTISGIRFVDARVNDVNGIIMLPDNWDASLYELHNINNVNVYNNGAYDFNVVTMDEWELLENNGAIFIPSSGGRTGEHYMSNGYHGYYWSTTSYDDHSSYSVCFSNTGVIMCDYCNMRAYGWSVRLVQDANNKTQEQ